MPVDDSLVRDAVLVVQDFQDVRESLENSGVGVAVYLNGVDKAYFGLGSLSESFEEGCVGLICQLCSRQTRINREEKLTVMCATIAASIWSGRAVQSKDFMSACQIQSTISESATGFSDCPVLSCSTI